MYASKYNNCFSVSLKNTNCFLTSKIIAKIVKINENCSVKKDSQFFACQQKISTFAVRSFRVGSKKWNIN